MRKFGVQETDGAGFTPAREWAVEAESDTTSRPGLLIEGIASIATLAGGLRRGSTQGAAAIESGSAGGANAGQGAAMAVASWGDRLIAAGPADDVNRQIEAAGQSFDDFARVDAAGGLVTPGLIDAHTHLVFAGTREAEWQMRARGAGYLEVLAAGGGILPPSRRPGPRRMRIC